MPIWLPPQVEYTREELDSGECIYIFTHVDLGILGNLRLIPDIQGSQLSWEPFNQKETNASQQPPDFIVNILKESQKMIDSFRNKNENG